ncbi:hypothetical protein [Klebsiella oxytoca]|nr:hypothetical protein [Klebsiella oxytoca]
MIKAQTANVRQALSSSLLTFMGIWYRPWFSSINPLSQENLNS